VKENYISYILINYISDGNFDAVFGNDWIDESGLDSLRGVVCDYAFAEYNIDAGQKYSDQVSGIFDTLQSRQAILREGDEYSGLWFKLRPATKKKVMEEILSQNPVSDRVSRLGEEALRRALVKVVSEDGLRSMEEKWSEPDLAALDPDFGSSTEEGDAEIFGSPNRSFFNTDAGTQEFVSLVDHSLDEVQNSALSNAEKSQAQGFLSAAKALAETPEPPVDLIWMILNRGNSIAGIGSFFLALITLIAMVV
jgi:hypothetical protein